MQAHTPGLHIRDYGEPVSLEAAECQFALLDGPDGAPVAYVYRAEDAALYAAAPDLLGALANLAALAPREEAGASAPVEGGDLAYAMARALDRHGLREAGWPEARIDEALAKVGEPSKVSATTVSVLLPIISAHIAALQAQSEPVAWRIEDLILPQVSITDDAEYARMKSEYRYQGEPTARVTPLYAHPPASADGWRPDREAVARIIDPKEWELQDLGRARNGGERLPGWETFLNPSLAKADAILALQPEGGRP